MVKIIYTDTTTWWIKLDELRDRLVKSVQKGTALQLTANLNNQCQLALLKFLEENPDAVVITSTRLLQALESRAEVIGRVPVRSHPDFLGLSQFDQRLAQTMTPFMNWR